jgi:hypothetical protein
LWVVYFGSKAPEGVFNHISHIRTVTFLIESLMRTYMTYMVRLNVKLQLVLFEFLWVVYFGSKKANY